MLEKTWNKTILNVDYKILLGSRTVALLFYQKTKSKNVTISNLDISNESSSECGYIKIVKIEITGDLVWYFGNFFSICPKTQKII